MYSSPKNPPTKATSMGEVTTTTTRRQNTPRDLTNTDGPVKYRRRQRLSRVIVPIVLLFSTTATILAPLLVSATTTDQPNDSGNNKSEHHQEQEEQPLSTSSSIIIAESESAPLHNVTISSDLPQNILDEIEDSFFDALSRDPSCDDEDCWSPPQSTVSETDSSDNDDNGDGTCVSDRAKSETAEEVLPLDGSQKLAQDKQDTCPPPVDKHWGSDPVILRMRDKLREAGSVASVKQKDDKNNNNSNPRKRKESVPKNNRPPVFLLPGLASTRLIAWKYKGCPQHPLLSDIKVLDIAWLNINLIFQMGTFESSCLKDCLTLGLNQSDTDDLESGCKLRPDEGLDAISSLSPGGIGSDLLVGGTNTVYAWLIQWLADNLGYDVTNIIGLPYDWRLSPNRMENRDGFLTLTRRRIEAAVKSNGEPGIMVAHSMGNVVFRYFLEWLRQEMREESYQQYLKRAERKARKLIQQNGQQSPPTDADSTVNTNANVLPGWSISQSDGDANANANANPNNAGWTNGVLSGFDEWWSTHFSAKSKKLGSNSDDNISDESSRRHPQLWELAKIEGDGDWIEWLEKHIWTYVGLSAPMLGAINPLRAVLSGENMGLPISDEVARSMEVSFGSTHSVNPISSKSGFCDEWEVNSWDEDPSKTEKSPAHTRLECLDDIVNEVESGLHGEDPWEDYPALKSLLKDRLDWDSSFPMIEIKEEHCKTAKSKEPCVVNGTTNCGPKHVESGEIFDIFTKIFKEEGEPLTMKREQLEEAFWNTKVPNPLNNTWERPLIKHVIMAYGVDIPTEVGYKYKKRTNPETKDDEFDGVPNLDKVIWEETKGELKIEDMDTTRSSLADLLIKKRRKRERLKKGALHRSGDGSVPYLSLSWAHTWLLHAARALRHSSSGEQVTGNALDDIEISHRPKWATEWVKGAPPKEPEIVDDKKKFVDTGTKHPHGTKYKPEMHRFHNIGKSRTTGIEYTTTVIEALGVEHKETTRNYDILAAVFTDVLKNMHDDFGLV